MNTQQQINRIDKRLEDLRIEYKTASDNRKKFINSGAKLFKEKRAKLVIDLENGL